MPNREYLQRTYRTWVPVEMRRLRRDLSESLRALLHGKSDPNLRRMAGRLRELRGAYEGERCFLMGNGPSLNQTDLSLLDGEHVWGSNRAYLLFDRVSWRPSHYVAIDTVVVPDNADELQALSAELPETRFFFPRAYALDGTLASADNMWWFRERFVPLDGADPFDAFSTDVTDYVAMGATVTVAMLQLAVWLGFDPIYLIGCDTDYTVDADVERLGMDELRSTADADVNHFDPAYFGRGKVWHEPHVEAMVAHYELAKRACDTLGVAVFNATVGGKLEVFPRVALESLFD